MSFTTEYARAVWNTLIEDCRGDGYIRLLDARMGNSILKAVSAGHIKKSLLSGEMGEDINLSVQLSTALKFLNLPTDNKTPVVCIDHTGMTYFLRIPREDTEDGYYARKRINLSRAKLIIQSTIVSSNMLTILKTSEVPVTLDRIVTAQPISNYSSDDIAALAQVCDGMYPAWQGTIELVNFVRNEARPSCGAIHKHDDCLSSTPAIVMCGKHDLIEPFSIKNPE